MAFVSRIFQRQMFFREEYLAFKYSNNSDLGCVVFFAGHWTYYQLPDHWYKPDIMAELPFGVGSHCFIHFLFKQDLTNTQNCVIRTIRHKYVF